MYRCCECGAYLDQPWEPHECQRPDRPKRRKKPGRGDYDRTPENQLEDQKLRMRKAWEEWDMN